jgi:hypothetical protein
MPVTVRTVRCDGGHDLGNHNSSRSQPFGSAGVGAERLQPEPDVQLDSQATLMRLIVAARLSRAREGQTGIDTQDLDARKWAESHGHTVVAVLADTISGRVSPFKRRNLGPWLTEPDKMAQYDAVLASKMDRHTRGRDWKIRQWAEDNSKKTHARHA